MYKLKVSHYNLNKPKIQWSYTKHDFPVTFTPKE